MTTQIPEFHPLIRPKTLFDSTRLNELGLPSKDLLTAPETLWQVSGEWLAGTSVSQFLTDLRQETVAMGPSFIDISTDIITLTNHRFMTGEAVQFSGATRPTIGGVQISNSALFYVEVLTKDTFKVHASRALASAVNFDGAGTVWNLKRYGYFYANNGANALELYNTIGAQNVTSKRYPPLLKYVDAGFLVPPNGSLMGGVLHGMNTGMVLNGTAGNVSALFVIDLDPDARAYGFAGWSSGAGRFTADSGTNQFTMTAHPFKSKDLVMLQVDGTTAASGGFPLQSGLYVKYIDANTFELYTDVALTSQVVVTLTGGGVAGLMPDGNPNRIRCAYAIPNSVTVRTPYTHEWWIFKDQGTGTTANETENMIVVTKLSVGQDGYAVDPATAGGALVYWQVFRKTRPALGSNFNEARRHQWGPRSMLRQYPTGTLATTQIAAGATITGSQSGATGLVVEHSRKRQTLIYQQPNPLLDFWSGENVTDGSTTLTSISGLERGPMPTKISQRFTITGTQDGTAEISVHHSFAELYRRRQA